MFKNFDKNCKRGVPGDSSFDLFNDRQKKTFQQQADRLYQSSTFTFYCSNMRNNLLTIAMEQNAQVHSFFPNINNILA